MQTAAQPDPMPADGTTLCEPAHRPQVAALKRLFEYWAMDRAFHDEYLSDPESAIAKTGLDVDPRAASLVLLHTQQGGDSGSKDPTELPETFVWYQDFLEGRFRRSMLYRKRELPSDPRFHDWTLRQIRRCEREMGRKGRLMGHIPVALELSSGCSVGCPFCALSAGRLKGVFRHTDENAVLWRDVLSVLHEVVGDAARRGICYCATEPLDNPDYELFLHDFYDEFGRVPQTTTAAATRNIERVRRLLQWGQQAFEHFDRISVLNERDFGTLIAAFTPEELLFTDLLPQFEEAPLCTFVKAGRNRGTDQDAGGTIACASGFIVNMWDRTVRLVTPVASDEEHPDGELVYESATFSDGDSFEGAVRGMIERHMHETIGLADVLGLKR